MKESDQIDIEMQLMQCAPDGAKQSRFGRRDFIPKQVLSSSTPSTTHPHTLTHTYTPKQ